MQDEALALVELTSVAAGLATVDALSKRATVTLRGANVVEPGVFVIAYSGPLAEVEESHDAALERAGGRLRDQLLLPYVDRRVPGALAGEQRRSDEPEAVGVVEGAQICTTIAACDRAVKYAEVELIGLRLTPGMGGRAYFVVSGLLHDVEAAVEEASAVLGSACWQTEIIARPSEQAVRSLLLPGTFSFRGA